MSWLKNAAINAAAPKQSIITVLRKNLRGYAPARSIDTVHASDVTQPNFCPRHWALLDMESKEKKDQWISAGLQATFDVGTATEKLLVEKWAGDAVVGNWACRRCGSTRTMVEKPQPGCQSHKDCIWEYQQMVFESKEYGISGSIDALMHLSSPKLCVTEHKIIKVDDWEKISAPLPEHRIRTSLYLKIIADSGSPYRDRINLHEGRVLYTSRGFGKLNPDHGEIIPWKEYVVKRDDQTLGPILQKAKQVKVFREQGLMPSGICGTALDKYAKSCDTCKQCFSGDHPPQQEPLE